MARMLSEHSQALIKKQSVKNMFKFKTLSFCQKSIFIASNFFMQMFNVSTLCIYKVPDGFIQNYKGH